MRTFLALICLAAVGGGGYYGYRQYFTETPVASYRTAEIKRGNLVQSVSATGNVEPLIKVLVGSQVSGTVIKWHADFNDRVTAGMVLAELDLDRINSTLDQRKAAVAVSQARVLEAKARLSTAVLERTRIENAYSRMAASEIEFEQVKATEREAQASVAAAEADVARAEAEKRSTEIEMTKHTIRSPIDGVVISRDIDEGQTVAASLQAPTLFTIANDLSQMRVNAAVSETDIGRIKEGMPADFRVDAYPGRKFRGIVAQVRFAETILDNVVTYKTMIDVDNADLALRPGMTATILFEVDKAENVLMVPNAALRFDPRAQTGQPTDFFRTARAQPIKPRVFRLASGEQLEEVPVELGLNDGSFTQIVSGDVSEGLQVVTDQGSGAAGARRSGPPVPGAGTTRGPRGA
ncbi:MAG: efflux RND transporter periplasmic adaptor subunit [Phycisphaerae bacterium]